MAWRAGPLLLCLLLGGAGCGRDADPIELQRDPLQVHAVLAAGTDSVTVLVSRPASDPSAYDPVRGAAVLLTHDGVTVRLHERSDGRSCVVAGRTPIGGGTGCYTATLPLPIAAGEVYGLEVLAPGGARVTGQTRVPHGVTFTAPHAAAVYPVECAPPAQSPPGGGAGACWGRVTGPPSYELIPLATIQLEWDAPPGAARVDATYRPVRIVSGNTEYPGALCQVEPQPLFRPLEAPRGSARWSVLVIHCQAPLDVLGWDAIHVETAVAVYDDAYRTYIDAVFDRNAARIEAVSAGLDGALGVFGAVNAQRREIVLLRVR
jgi:hypothetical protein